jgi:hypothetical protein
VEVAVAREIAWRLNVESCIDQSEIMLRYIFLLPSSVMPVSYRQYVAREMQDAGAVVRKDMENVFTERK